MNFPALHISADPYTPIATVDLGADPIVEACRVIGCRLIEKTSIDLGGGRSLDLLFDEEGALVDEPERNLTAEFIGLSVLLGQVNGELPAPFGSRRDLAEKAAVWNRWVRLHGDVIIVGADDSIGDWTPVPGWVERFAADAMEVA